MPAKKAQRTKGNVKPSSSSQAAQLLAASGQSASGFIGFSSQPAFVPATDQFDDTDSLLDAEFRLVLRKFSKRDTTTKVKALQEFISLCHSKGDQCVQAVVPFWPRIYNRVAIDVDHRVRELSQKALATLASYAGKYLAPQLKSLMGTWVLCMSDTYPTVASAAQHAFSTTFTQEKQKNAIKFCKMDIAESLINNILKQTVQSLSESQNISEEDMTTKYHRVVTSSMLAFRKLLETLGDESSSLQSRVTELCSSPLFWKHFKSGIPMIQGGVLSVLSVVCQLMPAVSSQHLPKIVPLVVSCLGTSEPLLVSPTWEAVLSLTCAHDNCWENVNYQKAFWPKLKTVLEGGCLGHAGVVGPCLLPLLSKIPNKNFTAFFDAFRVGLSTERVVKSQADTTVLVKSFTECLSFALKSESNDQMTTSLIHDQLLVVVEAALTQARPNLSRTCLYMQLHSLCADDKEFWRELSSYVRSQLLAEFTKLEKSNQGENENDTIALPSLFHHIKLLSNGLVYKDARNSNEEKAKVKFSSPDRPIKKTKHSKRELTDIISNFLADVQVIVFSLSSISGSKVSSGLLRFFQQLVSIHLSMSSAERLASKDESLFRTVCDEVHVEVDAVWRDRNTSGNPYEKFLENKILPLFEDSSLSSNHQTVVELVNILFVFVSYLDPTQGCRLLLQAFKTVQDPVATCVLIEKLLESADNLQACRLAARESHLYEKIENLSKLVTSEGRQEDEESLLERAVWKMLTSVLASTEDNSDELLPTSYVEAVMSSTVNNLQHLGVTDLLTRPNSVRRLTEMIQALLIKHKIWSHSHVTDILHHLLQLLLECPQNVDETIVDDLQLLWMLALKAGLTGMEGSKLVQDVCRRISSWADSNIYTKQNLTQTVKVIELIYQSVNLKNERSDDTEIMSEEDTKQMSEDNDENEVDPIMSCDLSRMELTDLLLTTSKSRLENEKQILELLYMKRNILCMIDSTSDSLHTEAGRLLYTCLYNTQILKTHKSAVKTGAHISWSQQQQTEILQMIENLVFLQTHVELGMANKDFEDSLSKFESEIVSCLFGFTKDKLQDICESSLLSGEKEILCFGLLSLFTVTMQDRGMLVTHDAKHNVGVLITNLLSGFISRCFSLEDTVKEIRDLLGNLSSANSLVEAFTLATTVLVTGGAIKDTPASVASTLLSGFSAILVKLELSQESRATLFSQLQILLDWLKDKNVTLLTASDSVIPSHDLLTLNSCVAKFLKLVAVTISEAFWEFSLVQALEWIQFLNDTEVSIASVVGLKSLFEQVLDFIGFSALTFTRAPVATSLGSDLPPDAVLEKSKVDWVEFFSEALYTPLLPVFVAKASSSLSTPVKGADTLLLHALANAAANCPKAQILSHQLTASLTLTDQSAIPDNLKTVVNLVCPLLVSQHKPVRLAAYRLIRKIIKEIPEHEKKRDLEDSASEKGQESESRSPPEGLLLNIGPEVAPLPELLLVDIEDEVELVPGSCEYGVASGYFLNWSLLLNLFQTSPNELRAKYAAFFKEHNCLDQLLDRLFRVMPNKPNASEFQSLSALDHTCKEDKSELAVLAVEIYRLCLETVPALVRLWWLGTDRRVSAFINKFTSSYLSPSLCATQLSAAQSAHDSIQDMTIRTRIASREVIAVCEMAEVKVNLTISLPENYPLGKLDVVCDKRVGVSQQLWDRWLLQLNSFLQHQNGSIIEGLRVWKGSIEKRFEGIEDCMVCFSVIHGTTFQLPKLTCRTCKKKFHSACLYKWFSTSQKSSCPLCRELF